MPTATRERVIVASPLGTVGERVIATPFQFQVTGEDNLRLSSWSFLPAEPLEIDLRTRDAEGRVQVSVETHLTAAATFTKTTQLIGLSPGFLLNVRIGCQNPSSAARRGDVYVTLDLVRGLSGGIVTLGTVLQGYVSRESALAWPGSPIVSPHEGPGKRLTVGFLPPAAGAGFSGNVTTGARWRLVSLRCALAADANVANRVVAVVLTPNALTAFAGSSSLVQTAGQTKGHAFIEGGTGDNAPGSVAGIGPLPANQILYGGDNIQITVGNQQVGDQLSAIVANIEQWIDP